MLRRMFIIALLTLMWVALWGDASPGTAIAGLVAAGLVTQLVPNPPSDRRLVLRPVQAVKFIGFFVWELTVSTATVARVVISPGARETRGVFITVRLAERAYAVRTLIANSISLTPGTLTVDVGDDGRTLHVHVIEGSQAQSARRSIAALEERACAAFAPEREDQRPPAAEVS